MKMISVLFPLIALFAFAPSQALSVYSNEKPKETKADVKSLSPSEVREFNKKIEWIQNNSSDIDRRMFDLGSKQFDISSTIWANNWALLTYLLALGVAVGGAMGGILYVILKILVLRTAEKRIKAKVKDAVARLNEENLFLRTIIHRSHTYLVFELAEILQQDEIRNRCLALAHDFAIDSRMLAEELLESVRKTKSMAEDDPQFQEYKRALDVALANLAYALSQKEYPTKLEKNQALELAKAFYESAVKNDNYHRIDTYAWVLIRCGTNEDEKRQGRQILRDLIAREDLSPRWRASRFKKYYLLFGEDP